MASKVCAWFSATTGTFVSWLASSRSRFKFFNVRKLLSGTRLIRFASRYLQCRMMRIYSNCPKFSYTFTYYRTCPKIQIICSKMNDPWGQPTKIKPEICVCKTVCPKTICSSLDLKMGITRIKLFCFFFFFFFFFKSESVSAPQPQYAC